jgi:hypothetical protein
MRRYTFDIPVATHVAKYLLSTHCVQQGKIIVRKDEPLGRLVESFLEKNFTSVPAPKPTGSFVSVSMYQEAKLLHIPPARARRLGIILKEQFETALVNYCLSGYQLIGKYEPNIRRFLELYDISEDEIAVNSAAKIVRDWEDKLASNQRKFAGV